MFYHITRKQRLIGRGPPNDSRIVFPPKREESSSRRIHSSPLPVWRCKELRSTPSPGLKRRVQLLSLHFVPPAPGERCCCCGLSTGGPAPQGERAPHSSGPRRCRPRFGRYSGGSFRLREAGLFHSTGPPGAHRRL